MRADLVTSSYAPTLGKQKDCNPRPKTLKEALYLVRESTVRLRENVRIMVQAMNERPNKLRLVERERL